eukprot:scaffold40187_cov45-Cyclotella_meneghiniana.AAC.1
MFKRMIDILDGTVRNPGVIRKQARKLGIVAPKMWTYDECVYGRLLEAEATEDKERARAIRTMMTREESSSMWSSLSYTFNDNGGRSNAVTRVERIENGVTVEYTEQSEVERVVREMTQNRFTLADSSPLCSGLLGEQLGYLANTEVAEQILTGKFIAPEEASNATVLVLEEISRIAGVMKAGKVSLSVSPEEFTQYWKKMKERTSSSYSKAHFGHYKAAAMYKQYAQFFAAKLSLIAQSGTPPSRWGTGMTVLLEKIAGLALVNKLRAILLFEADSNMFNRLIFGDRMMELAREYGMIPQEQYAEKQSDGQDGTFVKRLLTDLSRQMKIPLGIVSADAETCYDRIAHVFASLVFQAFGVFITAVMVMLGSIQHMKFYLRTGFGESKEYMTALLGMIIQGLCQGNAAAPAGWSLISAVLINVYKSFGHGAHFTTPISRKDHSTAGVLYVDDVDLFSMNSRLVTEELWDEVVDSTASWTELLTIPGGSGKADKCFGYFIDYEWLEDGSWRYTQVPDKTLNIVLPDGSVEGIALLPASAARVTLGVSAAPDGRDSQHLHGEGKARDKWKSIATRASLWATRLKNGHLPPKFAWVSYRLQLWSSLRYGLGTLAAPLSDLGEVTKNFAYNVLSYLGVNQNIAAGYRYLHSTFGGVGLISLSAEVTIGRLNMFLQHWDMPNPIGRLLRASLETLQLEIGCTGNPLMEPFDPMGQLATRCWMTSFWEGICAFGLQLQMDYPELQMPRENDRCIMTLAIQMQYRGDDLRSVNRCRISSCCIFLSDMASANGRALDQTRGLQN